MVLSAEPRETMNKSGELRQISRRRTGQELGRIDGNDRPHRLLMAQKLVCFLETLPDLGRPGSSKDQ